MPTVIPFPARRGTLGEVIELAEIRAGLTAAAEQGFSQADLQVALDQDRPLATHAVQLLGSADRYERRSGKLMLSRMIGTLRSPSDEPPPAA